MKVMNTETRYGTVHKTLHWLIALFVFMMLIMGLVMGDIPNAADKFWVYGIHKSLGITILALMLARLGWKFANWHLPKALPTHAQWERVLAGIVHWGLYVLLIAMPLSGWLMTAAANSTVNWFGFFVVPNPIGPDQGIRDVMNMTHEYLAWGIWAFLSLHVAGALKHAVIDRDTTLRRMVPFGVFMLLGLPSLAFAGDEPESWTIDRTKSTLGFQATQEGGIFDGQFTVFDGTIIFDPEAPENGVANITIDLNSVDSANDERDKTVTEKDWFDIINTPTATYNIDRFEKGATEGTYIAKGRLFLRGLERPLDMPFTLDVVDEKDIRTAHAVGKTTLKRLDFDVGAGQWADPAMVGTDVIVSIDLWATAKDK